MGKTRAKVSWIFIIFRNHIRRKKTGQKWVKNDSVGLNVEAGTRGVL